MLTKRTNVLLTEEDYRTLSRIAEEKGKTMAELIRKAVRKVYGSEVSSQKEVLKEIRDLRKKVDTKDIDYKELINHGRRF